MTFNTKYFSIVVLFSIGAQSRVLPERIFKTCKISDGDISKCFKDQIQNALPEIGKGIPEIKAPKLDPIEIDEIIIDQKENDGLWINAKLKDVVFDGYKDASVNEFSWDPVNLTSIINLSTANIKLSLKYDAKGEALTIPFEGKGMLEGNFTNGGLHANATLKRVKSGKFEHLKIDKVDFTFSVETGKIKLTSEDPGLQVAADFINDFFNDDPKTVLNAIQPFYADTIASWVKNFGNRLLKEIPVDEIFVE